MDNIRVRECAYYVEDSINSSDFSKEVISETCSSACAFDEAGNIENSDSGSNLAFRLVHFTKLFEPLVRNMDTSFSRLDGAERIIFSRNL